MLYLSNSKNKMSLFVVEQGAGVVTVADSLIQDHHQSRTISNCPAKHSCWARLLSALLSTRVCSTRSPDPVGARVILRAKGGADRYGGQTLTSRKSSHTQQL